MSATPAAPEVDEFDLDLRIGEALPLWSPVSTLPFDAQTDGVHCLPTGGGGTCKTDNATCPNTCDGATCPNTCPNTCAHTCPNTCVHTCANTCAHTCHGFTCDGDPTCARTCDNTHCFTCRSGCQIP